MISRILHTAPINFSMRLRPVDDVYGIATANTVPLIDILAKSAPKPRHREAAVL